MNAYIQATFDVTDILVKDQLIAMLSINNYEGFEETENGLIAFIPENDFEPAILGEISSQLQTSYETATIAQQNWNALWESNFEPVVVDDFCAIRADFHAPFTNTSHEIVITPKMSFGTGHHATTFLMVQKMKGIDFSGKKVVDFGTGTGILAILAEKLNAAEVLAIDYDEWSITNTIENLERNGCSKVEIIKEDHFPEDKKWDVILANINRNVIVDNLNAMVSSLVPGGVLLVSGLLKTDENEIITAFKQAGLTWQETHHRNNWITIMFSA